MSRVTPTILGLGAVLMVSACGLPDTKPGPPAAECSIESVAEKAPGYPYDLNVFETTVAPALKQNCAGSTCHSEPAGLGGFTVWNDIAKGDCGFAQTFNSLSATIDLNNPDQSKVVLALTTSATHPVKSAPVAATLLDYAEKASAVLNPTPGGGKDPNADPLNYLVFQSSIQPILDATNAQGVSCVGCHQAGIPQLKVTPAPAQNSAEAAANFFAVAGKVGLNAAAESSTFYQRATTNHGGGSRVISASEAATIKEWIVAGQAIGGGGQNPGCVPVENFNVAVFRDDIQPVLFGDFAGNAAACSSPACHGVDRAGGALVIKETNTPEQNLASFACFVNLTNPITSAVLACPLDLPGCPKQHPGQDVFEDANDPNFQRVLSYLYATKTVVQPLDFAFYARQINTIFNDVNAVAGGVSNITCADATQCHGVNAVGQTAPNGSNFPIIGNSGDEASLAYNFSSAINFTNFLFPEGSSLFLYPTNQIANLDNPFATGFPHPGGEDFAVDSVQALAILKWANGLRPNNQGFVRDWLVAGDYNATLITSLTAINEQTVAPSIFDPMFSAQFNSGQWDGLFSVEDEVDLNLEFPRAATAGRIGYAVAYVSNITGFDIQAQMLVTSNNAIRVFVDGQPVAQADDATNGVTALARFPAGNKSTRVMIKVFQRAADDDFSFSVQLSDELGNLLTDATGELVVKLSSDGGI